MATYTPNYSLPLYEGTDAPNLLDQYNAAINAIDTQLKTQADNVDDTVQPLQQFIDNVTADTLTLNPLTVNTGNALSQAGNNVVGTGGIRIRAADALMTIYGYAYASITVGVSVARNSYLPIFTLPANAVPGNIRTIDMVCIVTLRQSDYFTVSPAAIRLSTDGFLYIQWPFPSQPTVGMEVNFLIMQSALLTNGWGGSFK